MTDRPCPVWGNMIVDCEKILTGATSKVEMPCWFYNSNSRQCVVFDISDNLRDIPQAITALSFGLGPKKPPRVIFNSLEDYLEEIRADKDAIFRGIVRVTHMFHYEKIPDEPVNYTLYVLSSYIVGDQIIQLKVKFGSFQSKDLDSHRREKQKADKVTEKIKALCLDLLLDARTGTLEVKSP